MNEYIPRTKKEIVLEKIQLAKEEIFKMEIVRDFNSEAPDSKPAQGEVLKAKDRIKDLEVQITFLEKYLSSVDN